MTMAARTTTVRPDSSPSDDALGTTSTSTSTASTTPTTSTTTMPRRPSAWSAFVYHFLLPMTILVVVSNLDEYGGRRDRRHRETPRRPLEGGGRGMMVDYSNDDDDGVVGSTTTAGRRRRSSSSSSSDSAYRRQIDMAIERGKERRRKRGGTDTTETSSSSSPPSSSQQQQQQQQPRRRQSSNREGGGEVGVPNSPRSTELYVRMEANIERLRSDYERSRRRRRRRRRSPDDDDNEDEDDGEEEEEGGWPSQRILAALRYADYLRHRDVTIHDGGTHQAEAIDVYGSAIRTLEGVWGRRMATGEDVRLPEREGKEDDDGGGSSPYPSSYSGLNRELFLDHDSKSVEGALCAAYTGLGKTYFMSNMFESAVSSYEGCLSHDPSYLDSLNYRAQALLILGRYDESGRDYGRVLELDKERLFADAITGLAKVLVAREDAVRGGWDPLVRLLDGEIPRRTVAYERSRSSTTANGVGAAAASSAAAAHHADALRRMHHAMFAYHDVKTMDANEAWMHLSKGNEYKLSSIPPFDAEMERERVRRVRGVFRPDFFPQDIGSRTRAPIFVIGFVRSGSTLLERILDAHPLIVGTGEDSVFNGRLDAIRNEIVKASMVGDLGVLRETVRKLADDVVRDMKSRWEAIEATNNMREDEEEYDDGHRAPGDDQRPPYPTRFADKMLTNYMNVGFIHLLFPNALILHVAREPMDTIFSAFKHDFPPGGLDYTSNFAGLAGLYHSYRDVMRHWDEVLPGRVTHIRYEDMVTDLPNMAPRIIAAAGVPWDPTVLDFHKKKHAVNTLSTTQVRRGLYSHHFEGWKRYEKFLGPLLELVGGEVKYDLKTTLPVSSRDDAEPQ